MTTVTPLISAMVDRTRTSYRLMRNDRSGSLADKPPRAKIDRCPLLSESGH
jgi:hypothetical protein